MHSLRVMEDHDQGNSIAVGVPTLMSVKTHRSEANLSRRYNLIFERSRKLVVVYHQSKHLVILEQLLSLVSTDYV